MRAYVHTGACVGVGFWLALSVDAGALMCAGPLGSEGGSETLDCGSSPLNLNVMNSHVLEAWASVCDGGMLNDVHLIIVHLGIAH